MDEAPAQPARKRKRSSQGGKKKGAAKRRRKNAKDASSSSSSLSSSSSVSSTSCSEPLHDAPDGEPAAVPVVPLLEPTDVPTSRQRSDGKASSRSSAVANRNFSVEAKVVLRSWIDQHADAPYPSDAEVLRLSGKTGLRVAQIRQWLVNARRRLPKLKHLREAAAVDAPAPEPAEAEDDLKTEALNAFAASVAAVTDPIQIVRFMHVLNDRIAAILGQSALDPSPSAQGLAIPLLAPGSTLQPEETAWLQVIVAQQARLMGDIEQELHSKQ
eukprot:c7006_g1_i1.p1 GENE.c7006_g1_i1~~c7006_g1_i1.p1  ORF type:complete len:287 (+),score=31.77 c7006_g1_i1:50-862(+)